MEVSYWWLVVWYLVGAGLFAWANCKLTGCFTAMDAIRVAVAGLIGPAVLFVILPFILENLDDIILWRKK